MADRCGTCGTEKKPLFTSMYCPNDRCGKPPASNEWQRVLHKLPQHARKSVEDLAAVCGGIEWFVYETQAVTMFGMGTTWLASRELGHADLLKANVAIRINPDGTFIVLKNRYGSCRLSDVPDA